MMPGVPDNVLKWLHSVLRNEYRDVQRAYSNIARLLAAYPTIRPRTEIYTYENGVSALLVLLAGTVPVEFRGHTYQFPIQVWVPHNPRDPPICYVTPADGMVVRPGQHVSGDGRIYHPYLAKWVEFWDKSSLVDLVAILREVFAKEPPVISKQQVAQGQAPQHATATAAATPPPPLPPPPEDRRRPPPPQHYQSSASGSPLPHIRGPPPLPPKGSDGTRQGPMSPSMNGRMQSPNQGPPLPPLPHLHTQQQQRPPPPPPPQQPGHWQDPPAVGPPPPRPSYQPTRQSSLREQAAAYMPTTALPPHMRHHELESPVSPITPQENLPPQQFQQYPPQYHSAQGQQSLPHPPQQNAYQQPPPQQGHVPHNQPQQLPLNYRYPHAHQQPPLPIQQQRLPQPQIDLLSSPLDVQLPGQPGADMSTTPAPVPPVPPNPQKDALLHAISHTLVSQANQTLANNSAAFQSLSAQHQALLAAQQTLQSELDSLAHLSSILDSNDAALRQSIQQIDSSIASASSQRRPEIDAIIISPTIVGQQVYNAVAEEQAARDVRLALGRALDKGRIGVKEYVKEMRGVGREEFFRKAVVRKAGVGMGLEVGASGA